MGAGGEDKQDKQDKNVKVDWEEEVEQLKKAAKDEPQAERRRELARTIFAGPLCRAPAPCPLRAPRQAAALGAALENREKETERAAESRAHRVTVRAH